MAERSDTSGALQEPKSKGDRSAQTGWTFLPENYRCLRFVMSPVCMLHILYAELEAALRLDR